MSDLEDGSTFVVPYSRTIVPLTPKMVTYGDRPAYYSKDAQNTDLASPITELSLPPAVVREIGSDSLVESLFHRPNAYIHFSTQSHDDLTGNDLDRVAYEIDSEDEAFLVERGAVFVDPDKPSLSDQAILESGQMFKDGDFPVATFEWMIQWLEMKAFTEHQKQDSLASRHMVQYDETPCEVCREQESHDLNVIVICDICDLAVHQQCYGVRLIPEGSWLCDPCSQQLVPDKIYCGLCDGHGGAFKKIAQESKEKVARVCHIPEVDAVERRSVFLKPPYHDASWGHVQCALWYPYASFPSKDCYGEISLSNTVSRRHDCAYCNRARGATIKCSMATCKTFFHVVCAQKRSLVVAKEKDRRVAWCDAHTPSRFEKWRKKLLKVSSSERQARKRQKRLTSAGLSSSENCTRTSARRTHLATADSLKYCSGLVPIHCVEEMLADMEHIMPEKDLPRRKCVLAIFDHWTKKRKRSNGLPLLKSLHPSNVASSGTFLLNTIHARDVSGVYHRLLRLREYLQQLRLLLATTLEKEKLLCKQTLAKVHLYQNLIDPHRSALILITRTVASDFDTEQDFMYSATTEHPYDWHGILEGIQSGLYDKDANEPGGGSFFRDLLLVVDPAFAKQSLIESARRIAECIQQLQNGDMSSVTRMRDPLTIRIPKSAIRELKDAIHTLEESPNYHAFLSLSANDISTSNS